MLNNLKALVVVLALAGVVFYLARPLSLRYMSVEAFTRRRNVWFALTIVGFASPAFWAYALFAIMLLSWAAVRDENPLALYVMVAFVVPDARFYIPTFLINQLFDLTQTRLLSLVILIPLIVRGWNNPARGSENKLRPPDYFLLSFLLLQVVLQFPYESVTAAMRRAFLLNLDIFVLFYAFSRVSDRSKLSEIGSTFTLACAVIAPIGIFEWVKGWHLYTGLSLMWGDPNVFAYIARGGGLRAQASVGHSIGLGYVLAVALGLFLYVGSRSERKWLNWVAFGTFMFALYTTGSRACWIMAMLAALLFVVTRPAAARRLASAAGVGALIFAAMYFTPLKERVIDRLPIIGNTDQDTVDYRQQLFDTSVPLIWRNPFFGDPFVTRHMEALRQGQGIIDIVNGYIFSALFYGLVGLSLQMGGLLLALWRAAKAFFHVRTSDNDAGLLGAALLAVFGASLFFIATAGFGPTIYMLGGLLLSYSRCFGQLGAAMGTSPNMSARRMQQGAA